MPFPEINHLLIFFLLKSRLVKLLPQVNKIFMWSHEERETYMVLGGRVVSNGHPWDIGHTQYISPSKHLSVSPSSVFSFLSKMRVRYSCARMSRLARDCKFFRPHLIECATAPSLPVSTTPSPPIPRIDPPPCTAFVSVTKQETFFTWRNIWCRQIFLLTNSPVSAV